MLSERVISNDNIKSIFFERIIKRADREFINVTFGFL